ncbi:MAG: LUD domain-containing protein [Candidatus Dormibacteraceae bacterium]
MSATTTDFTRPASDATLEAVADHLRERNFEVIIVANAAEAKAAVLERIPPGVEVHSGKSKTLEDIGVFKELMESDRYDFVRKRTLKMDRKTQMREINKIGATPDYMLGSVQALTEAGHLVVASASGSQIGPYAAGAANLILVAGSQIVPDLDSALRRITEHVMPYEDARLREQMSVGTKLTRILILERDYNPGRTTVILVREPVGV